MVLVSTRHCHWPDNAGERSIAPRQSAVLPGPPVVKNHRSYTHYTWLNFGDNCFGVAAWGLRSARCRDVSAARTGLRLRQAYHRGARTLQGRPGRHRVARTSILDTTQAQLPARNSSVGCLGAALPSTCMALRTGRWPASLIDTGAASEREPMVPSPTNGG